MFKEIFDKIPPEVFTGRHSGTPAGISRELFADITPGLFFRNFYRNSRNELTKSCRDFSINPLKFFPWIYPTNHLGIFLEILKGIQ